MAKIQKLKPKVTAMILGKITFTVAVEIDNYVMLDQNKAEVKPDEVIRALGEMKIKRIAGDKSSGMMDIKLLGVKMEDKGTPFIN
jgi:hypothetical protein